MNLKAHIASKGITVTDFAALIGVSATTVYRYISGQRMPRRQIMRRIMTATDGAVRPEHFMFPPDKG